MKRQSLRKATCPVTELEDPRLEARPPAPNSELPELPPAVSDAWGLPARRLASGGRKAALALRSETCLLPQEWAGVSEASKTVVLAPGPCARPARPPGLGTPFPLAPVGISNRKKQAGMATAAAREASSPCLPGPSLSASWGGRRGRQG